MQKTVKLLPPMMPNYVFMEMLPRPRQEGWKEDDGKIPITDLNEKEAEEYGELMKQTFINHWRNKMAQIQTP